MWTCSTQPYPFPRERAAASTWSSGDLAHAKSPVLYTRAAWRLPPTLLHACPPLPRPFPFSQVPSGLPLVYLGCPLPFPGESRGVRGEVEGNGGTSEKGMAMVFNKLLEEGGGRQEGVGRISVQVLGSPHLLGWLSPQRLVQPLPSTLTAGPPSCLWHP